MFKPNESNKFEIFNCRRTAERSLDELIGISKGLLADGILNSSEVDFLITWLEANQHVSETWPACVLFERVGKFLEDGVIDENERKELFDLLSQITSGQMKENFSTTLPINKPQPKIKFEGSNFVVTGKFAYGPRKEIEKLIKDRGGQIEKRINQKIDYLVIGTFASHDWIHSSHGRKIEKAVNYKNNGQELAIISEDHFIESCFNSYLKKGMFPNARNQ